MNEAPEGTTTPIRGGRRSLAREYRPRQFEGPKGIVAQDHVTGVLKNQVDSGDVANAYLFTGTRGVGKTTAARVLAMALNCDDSEGGEPCMECPTCSSIIDGKTTMDVVEMDGATNRGVEDARELRERLIYAPSEPGRYKVYIIDEAHMLTTEAFNALLKVLEEPPPRVVFVFATTEPEKIKKAAPPILSRCQRFDFRVIGSSEIANHLGIIARAEGLNLTDESAQLLARRGRGSMRDALTALDQVSSFHVDRTEAITGETIRSVFNEPGELLVLAGLEVFAQAGLDPDDAGGVGKSRRRALEGVEYCTRNAVDHVEYFRSVKDALYDLFKVQAGMDVVGWSEEGTRKLRTLASRVSYAELQGCMRVAQESARQMREAGTSESPDHVLTLFFLNAVEGIERTRSRDLETGRTSPAASQGAARIETGRAR